MNVRATAAMTLALLVPGAGHLFLGRRSRALAFFAIVSTLFLIGLAVDGGLYLLSESRDSLLHTLASIGSMGSGMLYLLGRFFVPHGTVSSVTFEYGRMFTLSAGLMNLLLVLDCYDISMGRKQ